MNKMRNFIFLEEIEEVDITIKEGMNRIEEDIEEVKEELILTDKVVHSIEILIKDKDMITMNTRNRKNKISKN